jgi:type II secretory pathway component GspD/PulD (secretin)
MIFSRFTAPVGLCLLSLGIACAGEDVVPAPRMVEIELSITETDRVAASANGDLDLSASAEKLQATLLDLEKQGKLDYLAHVRLTSLENLPASVQVGQTTAVITGRTAMHPGGMVSTSVSERQTGLLVTTTARCQDDRRILVELTFEQSRLIPPPAADETAKEHGAVLPPPLGTSTLKTTLRIADGQTVVVGGLGAEIGGQKTLLVILATARVRD